VCVTISILLGVVMLWVFKRVTDEAAIGEAKNRLQAHLLEMRLFDSDPGVVLGAFLQLLRWNLRYFVLSLKPAFILSAPMIFLLTQMEASWGLRPLRVGEATTVTATLADFDATSGDATLIVREGGAARVETPGARSKTDSAVSWRVRAVAEGTSELILEVGGERIIKTIEVGYDARRVSPLRSSDFWDVLLYPVEPSLASAPASSVTLEYPERVLMLAGTSMHWIYWLLIFSIIPAFLIKWVVNFFRPETF
jgi:hypothetical protein